MVKCSAGYGCGCRMTALVLLLISEMLDSTGRGRKGPQGEKVDCSMKLASTLM